MIDRDYISRLLGVEIFVEPDTDSRGRAYDGPFTVGRDTTRGPGWFVFGKAKGVSANVLKVMARPNLLQFPVRGKMKKRGFKLKKEAQEIADLMNDFAGFDSSMRKKNPAGRVSQKQVNAAGTDWQKAIEVYGENNMETQRRFMRYMDLKQEWEAQNPGKKFGEMRKRNPARKSALPDNVEIVETIDGEFMILENGFQVGGDVDTSGAGNLTFPSKRAALKWFDSEYSSNPVPLAKGTKAMRKTKRKFSPAQIAAQKRFAEMARSGKLKSAAKRARKKVSAPKAKRVARSSNPRERFGSEQIIAQLTNLAKRLNITVQLEKHGGASPKYQIVHEGGSPMSQMLSASEMRTWLHGAFAAMLACKK